MIVAGAITFDQAVRAVDFRTLALLFGMMVVVAHIRIAGGIAALARAVAAHASHPAVLLMAIVAAAGVLSALFVNDTVCLVFTPLVVDVARVRGHRATPYLLALATGSNIGSVATITGNPQNMLIGSLSHIPFATFAARLAPVAAVGFIVDAAIVWAVYRRELHATVSEGAEPPSFSVDRRLLLKSGIVSTAMLAAFLVGYEPAIVAVAGAAVLLVTTRVSPRTIYAAIDWELLMLFVGLFVVVGAAEQAGIAERLFELLRPIGVGTVAGLTATAGVLSNVVSNVPAVMLLAHAVPSLPNPARAWLTLAMASTLAGNLTVLGSIANLIVVEGARRRGVSISFAEYARVGVPITVITLAIGAWWLR